MVKSLLGVTMKYELDGMIYDVIIIKKNNKNSYIRIKEDLSILVTTGYFTTKKDIKRMLDNNTVSLRKMLNRQLKKNEKSETFFYLGKSYDIIEVSIMDDIEIDNNNIYIPNQEKFEKWYKRELLDIFNNRLKINFDKFEEIDTCPTLKVRNMKTRWGVYNRIKHSITLNTHLLEYDYEKIDYVIIHELCHIVHFDHSKSFWNLVSKYCPNYKTIRAELKK